MKVMVRCTLLLEVDYPSEDYGEVRFAIEDNGCPGTGFVWSALNDLMEKHDAAGTCWACAAQGKNEIVA